MKGRLIVELTNAANRPVARATKDIAELTFVPPVGTDVECAAWGDFKKVTSVYWNVDEDRLYIYLDCKGERKNNYSVEAFLKNYRSLDGWSVSE